MRCVESSSREMVYFIGLLENSKEEKEVKK
jgi:hypothetical protein